jgi:tetratricopeptide (TPR) repeat protein
VERRVCDAPTARYTTSVTRYLLLLLIVSIGATAQQQAPVQEPPEEDVTVDPKTEYVLNPLQAEKEIRIGNYYFKKGSHKAALRRYEEAVKWDPNSTEGWYKLGEAHLKLNNEKGVRDAWKKYLELDPEGKYAAAVKKRLNQKS